jgi:glutamate/aspartate transport system permease protein
MHLEWGFFLRDIGDGETTYLSWLFSAWSWTLAVAGCAWVLALLLGSVVGTLRTMQMTWVARLANAWVELFRNIPLLVQIFLWYHVIPSLIPPLRDVPSFTLVVFGLGLFPRREWPSRCAPASSRCRAASAMPAWRWA